jgi:transcriptional regulator with XRE-family HTH domain
MSDFEKKLAKDLSQGKEYRESYAEAFSNEYLATQIQVLRKERGLTQAQLGERIGSNQGRVSVYEDEEYGRWSLDTVRRIASEFGLWAKLSFESYATLIHEATHFHPHNLLRPGFEDDRDVRRWLQEEEPGDWQGKTRQVVARWRNSGCSRASLAGWMQGFGLPGFNVRESTPVQHLLGAIPRGDKETWDAIAEALSGALTAEESEIDPLLRNPEVYRENLFGLAKSLGPRAGIQKALDAVYQAAGERFDREGNTGLGYEGETGLVGAMIYNQLDDRVNDRWKPIWYDYLTGGDNAADFSAAGHPFLPGKAAMGMRGLLGRPAGEDYWREVAQGIRDLERRFLRYGKANVDSAPNVLDELVKAVAVVFDWWGEPSAAQNLMRGSLELAWTGSWFMHASAAGAYGIEQRGWTVAVWTADEVEHKMFADTIASGLAWYGDWQSARSVPVATLRNIGASSRKASEEVMRVAA